MWWNFQILKQFLRGCKFSLERSKEKLDNFHLVKGALPEWFDRSEKWPFFQNVSLSGKRWDPSEPGVAELLKQGVYLPLPGYDDQVGTEKIIFPLQRSASKYFESWVWFLLGMLNFSFQGRFVVLCSFGKINPSKARCNVLVFLKYICNF